MADRLPPLGALRAFEAAGRLASFTRAAEELHVTQTAVSHQIRRLEEDLGCRLFRRLTRSLVLTEEGRELLPFVRDGFARLEAGVARVRAQERSGMLTVTAPPSFAGAWRVPRLVRFQARHPEIEVQLLAVPRMVDFAREPVDIGIRYGRGEWPGLTAERLLAEELFPVCAPALRSGPAAIRAPEDLARHHLIHVLQFPDDWRRWLSIAGVAGVDPERGPRFDTVTLAYEAAAAGMGVALGRKNVVQEFLASGRLVAPFRVEMPTDAAYYLVWPPEHGTRAKVRAFRDWVLAEVGEARTGEGG
ncbi:MAG TPA: transcriptional regulator GcvA [Geminicoccaceae bacterium]|nr:transcriptional regulator GcvA [Geminicoccaceae bacterium]